MPCAGCRRRREKIKQFMKRTRARLSRKDMPRDDHTKTGVNPNGSKDTNTPL